MLPHSKDAEMREHIENWHQSGQSQSQYCKMCGIAVHRFSYYKRKLGYMLEPSDNAPSHQLVPVSLKCHWGRKHRAIRHCTSTNQSD